MEKKRKALITVVTVILILIILLMIFSPNLTKRLTGEVSSSDNNTESDVVSNEFINEVCNISVDNENFMTVEGTIIMDEGKEGTATINFRSGDLVFTKEVTVKSNDYSSFTYILPRGEYSLTVTKDGYKTYEAEVSQSKKFSITLVANKNKDIIASSKTHYNTYYDYYSDGTIHLKTVGKLNLESEEEFMAHDYFCMVLSDALVKYLASNGYDINPVSQVEESDELGLIIISYVYSLFFGAEANDTNYRNMLIETNSKIESGQCTKDNYMDDENCEGVKTLFELFSIGPSGALTFEENKEVLELILEMPLPSKLIIDDDVVVLPMLIGITSDEVTIGKNVMPIMNGCFSNTKIGTLTINSPGFNNLNSYASQSKINNLIIGDEISEIPDDAFKESNIDNISLPNTLRRIGDSAFEDSTINAMNLPDGVKEIGNSAFRNCGISNIKLPKSLVSIGNLAFENNKLVSITIPKTITSIGNYAFSKNDLNEIYFDTNADGSYLFSENRAESVKLTIGPNVKVVNNKFDGLKLTELNLSYGVKEIGYSAFQNNNLTTVVLPSSITTIGEYAFQNNKLTSITIPKNVTSLGSYAFANNNLESIYFKAINLKTSGYDVFSSNKADSCNLKIESGVKVIPSRLFKNAKIASVEIPDSVTEIGIGAFSNNLLTELPPLPKGIKTIGGSCFSYNKLTNIVIPYGIETIDNSAFRYNQIETLSIPSSVININDYAFSNNKLTTLSLPSSVTSIGSFAFASNKLVSTTIPNTITSIGASAFKDNKLVSITIPNTVTSIGSYAFEYNDLNEVYWDSNSSVSNLFYHNRAESVKLTIGPNVKVVKGIFEELKITELNLSYGVKEIEDSAFSGKYLTSVVIPNSITTIGEDAFRNNKLTSITIPNSVTEIGRYAFKGNDINEIYWDTNFDNKGSYSFLFKENRAESVKLTIGPNVKVVRDIFDDLKLTELNLSYGIKEIKSYAFSHNYLTSVVIPSSITTLGSEVFAYNDINEVYWDTNSSGSHLFWCNRAENVKLTIGPNVRVVKNIFDSLDIAELNLSYGVKEIEESAFYVGDLTTVVLPNSITTIGRVAFMGNKLTEITIPESVYKIDEKAFSYNPLTKVTIRGDKTRFNSNWTSIGFPASLKPSS